MISSLHHGRSTDRAPAETFGGTRPATELPGQSLQRL